MANLHAEIGNFLGSGHSFSQYGDKQLRDTLNLSCGGFQIKLIQREQVVLGKIHDLVGSFVETTRAEVQGVSPTKKDRALKVLDNICWLLSFATQSSVVQYSYEYPSGSGASHSRSVIGMANHFRPVIEIRDGAETEKFIEACYEQYALLECSRKLNVVFDYLVQAEKPGQPTELRLLIAFVVLENLKDTYARSLDIQYINGYFKKGENPTRQSPSYSFNELLTQMFNAVGMRRGLKRVIKLRNEIIHSGVTRKPHSWQWSKYEQLQFLIREYVLRLLQFRGNYYTFRERGDERVEL
jgi:hypothetical protein